MAEVKSVHCSCRGLQFGSQHSLGALLASTGTALMHLIHRTNPSTHRNN